MVKGTLSHLFLITGEGFNRRRIGWIGAVLAHVSVDEDECHYQRGYAALRLYAALRILHRSF